MSWKALGLPQRGGLRRAAETLRALSEPWPRVHHYRRSGADIES